MSMIQDLCVGSGGGGAREREREREKGDIYFEGP
jgi:hypothetical protein